MCYCFGDDANKYMAAEGHFGAKSPHLVKHYCEDLGFQYLSATNKEEFLAALDDFANPTIGDKPIVLEVFTTHEDENEALQLMKSIYVAPPVAPSVKSKVAGALRSVVGDSGVNTIKNIIGKKK
jgi:2-succinyl-5-enolpyruvyl-6-hydroxy-3-cyclohexene-1-carboxylate synthase